MLSLTHALSLPSPSLPPFLSLSQTLTQQKYQNNMNSSVYVCVCLYWPISPGHGTCPGVWLICLVTLNWRRLNFSFSSRYQLHIASWLGMGLYVHLTFLMLGPCLSWTYADLVHAATVWINMCISPAVSSNTVSLESSITSDSYNLSSLLHWSLSLMKAFCLGLSSPKTVTLHILTVSVSCLC